MASTIAFQGELVFVYNADATIASAARDFAARLFASEKYSCNLCMVTYGPLTIRSPWKEFLDTLPNEKTFLHRDEFRKQYPAYSGTLLPAVFAARGGNLSPLLDAKDINGVKDWRGLKELLLAELAKNHGAS